VHKPTADEAAQAREHNERIRRESFRKKERTGLKGLADKGKEMFGKK